MPVRSQTYETIRDQLDQQEQELNRELIRQQENQMRALQAAQNWAAQSASQNIQAAGQTFQLGFNNMMSDLNSMRSSMAPVLPMGYGMQAHGGSLMNMSLSQSAFGAMGWGAPNTMRRTEYQRMASNDFSQRVGHFAQEMPLSMGETALDLGMFALAQGRIGAVAQAMGASAGAAGWIGAGGAMLAAPMMMAPVYQATNLAREQFGAQSRIENMLFAQSYGRMSTDKRHNVATSLRQMIRGDESLNMQEGTELLAYATEGGMLNVNQEAEDYKKNYKKLLQSTKVIMQTFHQSVKEAVETMHEMKQAGFTDPGSMGYIMSSMASSGRSAGINPQQMLQIMQAGAQGAVNTNVGMQAAGEIAVSGTGLAALAVRAGATSEAELTRLTGRTGPESYQAVGIGMSRNITQMMSGGIGMRVMAAISNEAGGVDKGLLEKIQTGQMSIDSIMARGQETLSRWTEGGMSVQDQRKKLADAERTMGAEEQQDIAISLADAKIKSLGKTPTRELRRAWLKNAGMTDEAGLAGLLFRAENPGLVNKMKQDRELDMDDQALATYETRNSAYSLTTRALRGALTDEDRSNIKGKWYGAAIGNIGGASKGIYGEVETMIDFGHSISSSVENALGYSNKRYAGKLGLDDSVDNEDFFKTATKKGYKRSWFELLLAKESSVEASQKEGLNKLLNSNIDVISAQIKDVKDSVFSDEGQRKTLIDKVMGKVEGGSETSREYLRNVLESEFTSKDRAGGFTSKATTLATRADMLSRIDPIAEILRKHDDRGDPTAVRAALGALERQKAGGKPTKEMMAAAYEQLGKIDMSQGWDEGDQSAIKGFRQRAGEAAGLVKRINPEERTAESIKMKAMDSLPIIAKHLETMANQTPSGSRYGLITIG